MHAEPRDPEREPLLRPDAPELWSDPELPFGCTGDHIEEYAAQGKWTALFNAIVLIASPLRPQSIEQSM
jgi:hypothetical protein